MSSAIWVSNKRKWGCPLPCNAALPSQWGEDSPVLKSSLNPPGVAWQGTHKHGEDMDPQEFHSLHGRCWLRRNKWMLIKVFYGWPSWNYLWGPNLCPCSGCWEFLYLSPSSKQWAETTHLLHSFLHFPLSPLSTDHEVTNTAQRPFQWKTPKCDKMWQNISRENSRAEHSYSLAQHSSTWYILSVCFVLFCLGATVSSVQDLLLVQCSEITPGNLRRL